jgi:hypothetical protein
MTPLDWPVWPILPLKRYVDRQHSEYPYECGVIIDAEGYETTVFKTNMFLVPRSVEKLLALPKEVYRNAEEVVSAGWLVD